MSTTVIMNARIFDGEKITEPKTVVIENGVISKKTEGDQIVDGKGCTLLPGLIDAHVHVDCVEQLELAAKAGVTTMFEMANHSAELLNSLRSRTGLTNLIGCYFPATAELRMDFPKDEIVAGCEDAERYVKEVVDLGADYVKIIIEDPGVNPVTNTAPTVFTTETVGAIVKAAHKYNKLTVAHVTTPLSYKTALDANVDILTHTPLVAVLPQSIIDEMKAKKTIDIPTMVMMEGIASKFKKINPAAPLDIQYVIDSVHKMHESGITILAGTDANNQAQAPCQLPHGKSLHHELDLLVEAGLTPIEALQSATSIPAKVFGLTDRGIIKAGNRADLLLVEGNPTENIKDIQAVKAVWIKGERVLDK